MSKIKGTVSELKIALWYISKGWQVYLPVDQNTPVDMVVIREWESLKIQVKTIYQDGHRLRANIDHNGAAKYSKREVDIMACVYNNKTWIIPMADISNETTLNFGREDGGISITRGNFDHTKYYKGTLDA